MDENSKDLTEDRIVIQEKLTPAEITFEKWRKTLGLFVVLFFLITIVHPPEKKRLSRIKDYIKERRRKSGRWKKGEKSCTLCSLVESVLLKTPLSSFFGLVSLTWARSFRITVRILNLLLSRGRMLRRFFEGRTHFGVR